MRRNWHDKVVAMSLWFIVGCCFASAATLPEIAINENRTPVGHLESGMLTLHLEVRSGKWHPEASDGRLIETYCFAERGHAPKIPAPLIRVPQGTEVRVSVRNLLRVAVAIHGLHYHPGKPTDVIHLEPGERKETHFSAGEPGSYIYWASTAAPQGSNTDGPMSGGFIVDAPTADMGDRIFVIQLWDRDVFHPDFQSALTINGKSWPYTERVQARVGHPEHWRILNPSPLYHPMHLHGFFFHVDAVGDGESEKHYTQAERRLAVTETVKPGHVFEMTWIPDRTGNWLFHCHILDHMDSYFSPVLYGPQGPPPVQGRTPGPYESGGMGMAKLVLGITVSPDGAQLEPASTSIMRAADEKHLFVRERPASAYIPAGPGFYLEGVSQQVGAIGPPLVLTRGVRTAITVTNELSEPTAIHWHGMEIESAYDGVPGWAGTTLHTTPGIAPGTSFVAYMTPPRAGTFIYHTHWHDVKQLVGGMYGALLVMPPGQKFDPTTDKVFVLGRSGVNELKDPMLLNGSPQPGVMVLPPGKRYRLRLINITPNDLVNVSLVGDGGLAKWRAIAKDGADLPPQQATVRDAAQLVSVGETYDFEFAHPAPGDYELRFTSLLGKEVTQDLFVVPPGSGLGVFAMKP